MLKLIATLFLAGSLAGCAHVFTDQKAMCQSITQLQGLSYRLCVAYGRDDCQKCLPKAANYYIMLGQDDCLAVFTRRDWGL
jgi:hypothetical protein